MRETWEVNGVPLDWKAREVLQAIDQHDGEANTTQIKDWTGIDHNQIIHHRYTKLVDAGLITTREGTTSTNRTPPLVATLTDAGEEFVENEEYEVVEETDAMTMDERVTRLEQQLEKVRSDMWQVKSDIRGLRESFEDVLDHLEGETEVTTSRESGGLFDGARSDDVSADELDFGND